MEEIDHLMFQATVLLRRQFLLTERLIQTQSSVLKNFEEAIEGRKTSITHVLDVHNYVFALIDHLFRYKIIAHKVPRLNQKNPEFRSLDEAIDLRDARDQIQHINEDIRNNYDGPLLGNVCWISNKKQYIAVLHDVGRTRGAPGIVFDAYTETYMNQFCYVYNNKYYDLDRAAIGMRHFHKYIISEVKIEIDGKPYADDEHYGAFSIK